MKELAASLDASLQSVAAPTISTQRLPQVRNTLSEYVAAVQDPFGTLAMSPYRAYGELGRVLSAPRASISGAVDKVTLDQLNQAVRDLQDLAATSAPIGIPSEHAWRESTRTFYSEDNCENIGALAHRLSEQITTILT